MKILSKKRRPKIPGFPRYWPSVKARRGRWWCMTCRKEKKRKEFECPGGGRPRNICKECQKDA